MSVYTKRGDKGITDMARTKNVSKSDDRIQLVGAIDELNSHIGLVKCMLKWEETVKMLSSIQDNLDLIAAGVEDPYSRDFKVNEEIVDNLEKETDRLEELCGLFIPSCEICGVIRCPRTDRGSKCGETKYKKAGCGKTESENAEYNFRDKQWD